MRFETSVDSQHSSPESGLLDEVLELAVADASERRPHAERPEKAGLSAPSLHQRLRELVHEGKGEIIPPLLSRIMIEIERLVGRQLNEILHSRRFQELEASWRSLHQLVVRTAEETTEAEAHAFATGTTAAKVQIRVLNVSKSELATDLEDALEFDQSQFFSKVYEEELGTPGGTPFGLLIGNYSFTNHPEDIEMIRRISGVAACAFAPFIASAAPSLLGLDNFDQLHHVKNIESIFQSKRHIAWRSLRSDEDSRFFGLTIPRVLLRDRYHDDGSKAFGFRFRELSESERDSSLWGPSSFALAEVCVRGFLSCGWFANIRGNDRFGGGAVQSYADTQYEANPKNTIPKPSTDVIIDVLRDRELAREGFMCLCQTKDAAESVFYSMPTIQQPKTYDSEDASASARLSAMLPYILCVSRFAHLLKIQARDWVGGSNAPEEMQRHLKRWIIEYVTDSISDAQRKAEKPLRKADIRVSENPHAPGQFNLKMLLQPHFQLDEMEGALQFITQIETPNQ